jgi:hypothetical protein
MFFIQRDFRDIVPSALFSQEKKKFFQIRGNNLSQESKTFLFQKSVLLSCDSDVLHVCGGGYFFHTSVSWKKRDGGYI